MAQLLSVLLLVKKTQVQPPGNPVEPTTVGNNKPLPLPCPPGLGLKACTTRPRIRLILTAAVYHKCKLKGPNLKGKI